MPSVNWSIFCCTRQPVWHISANSTRQRKQFVRETNLKRKTPQSCIFTPHFADFETSKDLSKVSRPTESSPIRQSKQRSVAQVLLARSGECGIALIVWWEVCPHAYCRRLRFLCVWPLITCMRILGFLAFPCILMCSTELGMRMCRVNHFLCPTADGVR